MTGVLYLLPNSLCKTTPSSDIFPPLLSTVVAILDGLVVENEKEGRVFLKRFSFTPPKTFRDVPMQVLNKHTGDADLTDIILQIIMGRSWGVISDAGLCCIADPGHRLVALANQKALKVVAVPGPSAIVEALMLSGFGGQQFTFHGYLPQQPPLAKKQILQMQEQRAHTHIFIETPYRNEKLLSLLLATLEPKTLLCIAWNLGSKKQSHRAAPVSQWQQKQLPNLHKIPAVFLIRAL